MTPEQALQARDAIIGQAARDGVSPKFLHLIANAEVIAWEPDIFSAAIRHSDVFIGEPMPSDLCKPMLWLNMLGPNSALLDGDGNDLGRLLGTLYLQWPRATPVDHDYVTCHLIGISDTGEIGIHAGENPWAMNKGCPDNRWADVNACIEFMNQEFIQCEETKLPRHIRRKAEVGRRPPLPLIKTITLRRAVRDPRAHLGSEPRDWSCSWIVGGHWRKQWYPSTGEHKPKYISPYVKGDLEKPLREPKGTVYVVRR